ncbi:hypothetical protein WT57_11320 [Burkholderia pseudomultivorans]|uniref:Uncharacterized protein n=1 Tax=Burkholderia pseudomultivorans TaxID=1207504 RepID=A0A132F5H6_9BURK|nr:hypothetical protein WT57_11320 [Burkholderia pseudomultivorans]
MRPLTTFDGPILAALLQHLIDNRLRIDHMTKRVEVVKECCQVSGCEVNRADIVSIWFKVASANGDIVRKNVRMVIDGLILETGMPDTWAMTIDERETLASVCDSFDASTPLDRRHFLVRVKFE